MNVSDNDCNINSLIMQIKRLNATKYAIIIQKAYKRFRDDVLYRQKYQEQYELLDNLKNKIFFKDKSIRRKKNFRIYLKSLWNSSYNAYIPEDLDGKSMAHCFARFIFAYIIPPCTSGKDHPYKTVTRPETINLINSNGLDYYLTTNHPITGCFHPEMREMQKRYILTIFQGYQLHTLNCLYAIITNESGIRGYGYYLFQVNGRYNTYLEPKPRYNNRNFSGNSDCDKQDFTWCYSKKDNMIDHEYIEGLVKLVDTIDENRFWGWDMKSIK